MLWKTAALIAAAILTLGAAPAPKGAAKPVAAKTALKPATPRPASDSGFDARDPASMIAILGSAGAKAEVAHKEADAVYLAVSATAAAFTAQFAGCDAQGRKCAVALFDSVADKPSPTLSQINAYNQTSAMCRGFQDKGGKAHVVYSTLLFPTDSRERITQQLVAWRGCLAEFRDFVADPVAYLAAAP
jgi:hypothetical protein